MNALTIVPQNLNETMAFAQMISKSNMIPKDYQGRPENIIVAVQWGYEVGLSPLQAMQNISVINGRPSIWGDAAMALVRRSGLAAYIHETLENGVAVCTVKRKGEHERERTVTFSIEDAKRANLWGKQGPWTQYPDRMLQMRARSWALRDVFADVLKGVHIAEEAQDIPEEKPTKVTRVEVIQDVPKQISPPQERRATKAQARDIKELCKILEFDAKDWSSMLEHYQTSWEGLTHAKAEELLEFLMEAERNRARKMNEELETIVVQQNHQSMPA